MLTADIVIPSVLEQVKGEHFEAFRHTDHTIVMSIGNRTQTSDLGEIPQNFIVENYVPQTGVLQYAKLFITHGGMNSTHEGLYYGVPLIVIPQSTDQPIIADQIANIGASIQLQMQSLTANQLREAADHVLSLSSFKKAAANIRESFRKSGGYHQAVDEIFELATGRIGNIPHKVIEHRFAPPIVQVFIV